MITDHAQAAFEALMQAPGLLAEAREHSGIHNLPARHAVGYVIGQRWPHLPEREAFAAAARHYEIELPAVLPAHLMAEGHMTAERC